MPKKKDIFFIVSKTGKSESRASFYDNKGKSVPKDSLKISYRSSDTGRLVTKPYSMLLGRDSKAGEFIPVEEARRRPSATVERVPKDRSKDKILRNRKKSSKKNEGKANLKFKDIDKNSPIRFKR